MIRTIEHARAVQARREKLTRTVFVDSKPSHQHVTGVARAVRRFLKRHGMTAGDLR